jgi:hypothetical protein
LFIAVLYSSDAANCLNASMLSSLDETNLLFFANHEVIALSIFNIYTFAISGNGSFPIVESSRLIASLYSVESLILRFNVPADAE